MHHEGRGISAKGKHQTQHLALKSVHSSMAGTFTVPVPAS